MCACLSGLASPVMARAGGGAPVRLFENAAASAGDDVIVVTAQRRPVEVEKVPAAIDLVSSRLLKETSTRTFEGLARIDPSLQLSAYQGETQMFIRGIGAVTFIGGFDSSVAVFSDDIYLSRPSAVAPALFDVERVEILKGPQGSLYGRNATGGAILLVNRKPSDQWEGEASLVAGNYRTASGFAAIGGPLSSTLSLRAAVGTNNHGGYTRLDFGAVGGGRRRIEGAENQHDITGRLSLRWRPGDTVTVDFVADYYRADDRAVVFHFAGPGYANNPIFLARIGQGEVGPYGRRTITTSQRPFNRPENAGVSGKITVDTAIGTLSSLTAFRRTHPMNRNDMSNSTVLAENQYKEEQSSQLTQDLVLASAAGKISSYVIGMSYFHERNEIRNEYFFPFLLDYLGLPGSAGCCLLKANGTVRTDAVALFADGETPIAGALRLVAGARWSREWREGSNLLDFTGFQTINRAPFIPSNFSAFTPKVGLHYRPQGGVQAYATLSRGFKSGGYNIGTADNAAYRPEKIWAYEIGSRIRIAPLAMDVDLSAFHYDYSDLQVQDVAGNTVVIRNAASAKVDGAELALKLKPAPRLSIDASGTYLHARFTRYRTVNLKTPELGVLDLAGHPLPQAPRFKGRISGEYRLPLDHGSSLALRLDALWQDRIYFSAFKDPRATQGAFAWLKARMSLRPSDWLEVAAFVDNLTNVRTFSNISITGDLDASRATGNLTAPRTFGVEFRRRF